MFFFLKHVHRCTPRGPFSRNALRSGISATLVLIGAFHAGPALAQQAAFGDSGLGALGGFAAPPSADASPRVVRLHEDGAAQVALAGGLEITLEPGLTLALNEALEGAEGADLLARIERLVSTHARNDATLAAAIGRYAVARAPARHEAVSLGVLRGNPGASRLLLENLTPPSGGALARAKAQGGDRPGLAAAGPDNRALDSGAAVESGAFANPDPAAREARPGGEIALSGAGGFSTSTVSSSTPGTGSTRFQAPRRSLFSSAISLAGQPPAAVASPSQP